MNDYKIRCPLCNSNDVDIEYKSVKDIEHSFLKQAFNYYKCKNCELIFIYPLPSIEQIISFYGNSYQCYSTIIKKDKSFIKEFIKKYFGCLFLDKRTENNFKKIFKLIKKPVKELKILEYGCGGCNMIFNLKEKFALQNEQILGVDFSKNAIQNCKNNGMNVRQVYKIDEVDGKFDIIYSFQVLEHLLDPKDFIDKCYSKLQKGGILYLQLPNNNSLGHKLFKYYWKGNDFPRRLYQFNQKSLSILIKDKFKLIDFQTDRFYISSIKLKQKLKLSEKHWTDKAIWDILLGLHFGNILGFFGKGDNIHLILRKNG